MDLEQLGDAEMLELLQLANHLHELPANPIVRHEVLLEHLCAMTESTVGLSALLELSPREAAQVLFFASHGLDKSHQQAMANRYLRSLDEPLSAPPPLIRLLESRGWELPGFRFNGEQDARFHDAQDLCRSLGLGTGMFSTSTVTAPRLVSVLSLHRARLDQRSFTAKHRRMLKLLHSVIGWNLPRSPSPRARRSLRALAAPATDTAPIYSPAKAKSRSRRNSVGARTPFTPTSRRSIATSGSRRAASCFHCL